ncbi:uncharacterized protein LOC119648559 [Hermetia illucens]|uniref:uncharacterized protein LOC119648559 n=1 Tax=Hermetia illucens TaxID=343691 RepID=UPI0018CC6826|nr:uncharacterized protein LOC119648559 [Hermetia illucens]
MSLIASRCKCSKDTDLYEIPSIVQRYSKISPQLSIHQKDRNADAYKAFMKKISGNGREIILETTMLHGDDNTAKKGGGDSKLLTRLNPSKEGSNRYSKDHFGSTIPDEFNEQRADATVFTSEEKEKMFAEMMSPWMKAKPQKQANSKIIISGEKKIDERNHKVQTIISNPFAFHILSKLQDKKKQIDAKAASKNENEFEEFMANATVQDLQRYFRTISSRTSSKPCNFSTDTFLRAGKIQVDHERVKQLRAENFTMVFKINQIMRSKNGALPTARQLEAEWKNTIKEMRARAKYPLTLPGLVNLEQIDEDDRPRVFLELGVENGNILGTIVLSLYLELMPITVTNFVALCENFKTKANENRKNGIPHLAGSPIHRIFPDLYFEGGDILTGHGGTGMAARGVDFYPEHMEIPHDHEGTISMSVTPDGRINSLFAISFRPLELLKGKRPAFGRVVKGLKLLETIKSYGTKNGKPKQKILITRCGLIHPK